MEIVFFVLTFLSIYGVANSTTRLEECVDKSVK